VISHTLRCLWNISGAGLDAFMPLGCLYGEHNTRLPNHATKVPSLPTDDFVISSEVSKAMNNRCFFTSPDLRPHNSIRNRGESDHYGRTLNPVIAFDSVVRNHRFYRLVGDAFYCLLQRSSLYDIDSKIKAVNI
jgi:hypothetical protein